MRRLYILFFFILLMGLIFKPCFSEDENKMRALEAVKKLLYEDFKEIESFGTIWVLFEGEDAQNIGLNEQELTDYVKLRFKNNFGKVKYQDISKDKGKGNTIFENEAEAKKIGCIRFLVWVVGVDYPIAYYVKCEAGNFKNFLIWSDAVLGYGSKENVPDSIRKSLNEMIERLAIDFFKARGEL